MTKNFDANADGGPLSITVFLAEQRELLDRLERFAATSAYTELLSALRAHAAEDPERWFAVWLIEPSIPLRGRPIEVADEPDGFARISNQLARIAHGVYS